MTRSDLLVRPRSIDPWTGGPVRGWSVGHLDWTGAVRGPGGGREPSQRVLRPP